MKIIEDKTKISHTQWPEYDIWIGIKQRCHNKKYKDYKNYGGRGIIVCEKWRNNFFAFYWDMGPRPNPLYSIERKDNDGHYEPNNCIWGTKEEQTLNRRKNIQRIQNN